jgi:LytS/YehU family sensor histidine kinase
LKISKSKFRGEKKMKNLKNFAAMIVMVTVMGVSSSFAGIMLGDRSINNGDTRDVTPCTVPVANGGILLGDFAGILLGDFAGILLGDKAAPTCGGAVTEGILLGD